MSLEDLKGVTNEPSPRPIFQISTKNDNVVKKTYDRTSHNIAFGLDFKI